MPPSKIVNYIFAHLGSSTLWCVRKTFFRNFPVINEIPIRIPFSGPSRFFNFYGFIQINTDIVGGVKNFFGDNLVQKGMGILLIVGKFRGGKFSDTPYSTLKFVPPPPPPPPHKACDLGYYFVNTPPPFF